MAISEIRFPGAMVCAAVESAGAVRVPGDYRVVSESIAEAPSGERYLVEKRAAAYLADGKMPKADPAWKARGLYGLSLAFVAQSKPEAVNHHLEKSLAVAPLADNMDSKSRICLREFKVGEALHWACKARPSDSTHESATVALTNDAIQACPEEPMT